MEIRAIPVHQSLHRPLLIVGAERELVMISAIIALMVGVGGTNLISTVSSIIFWIISLIVLRKIAKKDPLFSKIYLRHIKQQGFYPSRSSIWRKIEGYKVKK